MKIVMITSESNPFVKTGGLADVVYSLSKELVVLRQDVSVFLPYYSNIKRSYAFKSELVSSFMINVNNRNRLCEVHKSEVNGIKFYLLANKDYFDREGIYGYDDDGERFAFFNLASRELLYRLQMKPNIIHTNDWHTGMFACLCKEDAYAKKYFKKTKFVFSIHNPAFQGQADRNILYSCYSLHTDLFDNGKVRFNDRVSTLKAGIEYNDKIVAVSPNHRYELLTKEGSMGLNNVLQFREYDFVGILNGIDYEEFDPLHDEFLTHPYSIVNYFREKEWNKRDLFKMLNLIEYGKPTFAIISRLTWQKGMDIVYKTLDYLLANKCNVLVLGTGEDRYENMMRDLARRYPKNMSLHLTYDDELAHKIYASSDFFLMPSIFEPCGLSQLISQRYGTIPIVRATGGLKDTVIGYDGRNLNVANGFIFDIFSEDALLGTTKVALDVWNNIPVRKEIMKNGMKVDNSWRKSAKEYLNLYKFN